MWAKLRRIILGKTKKGEGKVIPLKLLVKNARGSVVYVETGNIDNDWPEFERYWKLGGYTFVTPSGREYVCDVLGRTLIERWFRRKVFYAYDDERLEKMKLRFI